MAIAATEQPIFLITDRSRRAVIASDGYCALVDRDRSGIVGRCWDEWIPPEDLDRCRAGHDRLLTSGRERYCRRVPRADGSGVTIAVMSSMVRFGTVPHVLCHIAAMFPADDMQVNLREHRAEVALYIEAMAGSLANVVTAAGLTALGGSLSAVAGEAARLAGVLAARHGPSRN